MQPIVGKVAYRLTDGRFMKIFLYLAKYMHNIGISIKFIMEMFAVSDME